MFRNECIHLWISHNTFFLHLIFYSFKNQKKVCRSYYLYKNLQFMYMWYVVHKFSTVRIRLGSSNIGTMYLETNLFPNGIFDKSQLKLFYIIFQEPSWFPTSLPCLLVAYLFFCWRYQLVNTSEREVWMLLDKFAQFSRELATLR